MVAVEGNVGGREVDARGSGSFANGRCPVLVEDQSNPGAPWNDWI
jgi:hypothetical protein